MDFDDSPGRLPPWPWIRLCFLGSSQLKRDARVPVWTGGVSPPVCLVKAPMADGEWGGENIDAAVGDEKDRVGEQVRRRNDNAIVDNFVYF